MLISPGSLLGFSSQKKLLTPRQTNPDSFRLKLGFLVGNKWGADPQGNSRFGQETDFNGGFDGVRTRGLQRDRPGGAKQRHKK
ncbi:MAG: hypothetical protein A2600_10515 [Candidatus Lambdaproteobacteria bacterium RIFOXYD1_FULL_56_27]|uniref:Uncharacterized protein n=1 Tax=Candidatus Lambdaproteobacteria bacterium RIFOXYD2_FULL_56_26 TaxID=1817773 RepID=A0A1F6GQH5_9PROT|nr:MAG: hypothetical protein A2557_09170 [Candidatus Lambdaproteobacteria bacterium RIFOXYD2_FULL_56_26]OGH04104.1 MAG: hypothetical protein A2426_02560 [Candidatus Lambdaproteobacteria bacterium RIFOXYC1_FULL_56_13]OGH06379.1 MAG: hypothetical protein A2600_10515 [Candidatus Lambdaproteobacteria bacterium RIFOXYD1_FULL_56_27]